MRIQSNFKDYYDIGMKYGQDQTLIYKRYTKKVEIKREIYFPYSSWSEYFGQTIKIRSNIIGFCGKRYPIITFLQHKRLLSTTEERQNTKYLYNIDDLDKYIIQYIPKKCLNYYLNGIRTRENRGFDLYRKTFEDFFCLKPNSDIFNRFNEVETITNVFEKYNCPIYYYELNGTDNYKNTDNLVINGQLNNFNFLKMFDPYQAFSQLESYLGNIAIPMKPIPKLDDVTMAEIKGFNKYSFRKDPKR